MNRFMIRFPEFKQKALTLSFDDGKIQDKRMVEVLDRYGLKCTFNLESGRLMSGLPDNISADEAKDLYQNHEVALHSVHHPFLDLLPYGAASLEVARDRENLENIFDRIVTGMAYPMGGTQSEYLVNVLRSCGIHYARTTHATYNFNLPQDWMRLDPTLHHTDPKLLELSRQFVALKPRWVNQLFYVWGHSYEFDRENVGWQLLDDFCQIVSGHEDIWYATNGDLFEYLRAAERLETSIDTSRIYNPTTTPLYIEIDRTKETLILQPDEYRNLGKEF